MLRFEDLNTERAAEGLFFLEVDTEVALDIVHITREKGNQDNINELQQTWLLIH